MTNERMRYWENADFPGYDIQPHLTPDTLEECMDRCLERSDCQAFTYDRYKRWDPSRGWCFLKTKPANYNMNYDGLVSGMKCGLNGVLEPPKPPDNKYPLQRK